MERHERIAQFLEAAGWDPSLRRKLAGDASFRRYDRLVRNGAQVVLMDAPPPQEDVRPFLKVARLLSKLGLSAPAILAESVEAGLLLLEDFGDSTYTRLLEQDGASEDALYTLAIDLLIDLHRRFDPTGSGIPPYDDERLLLEASLLVDWYYPAIEGQPLPPEAREEYLALWRGLLPVAREIPATLVLRDYHVDNLMLLKEREGVAACGLLDFQDAVIGPATYDLVSLLEDARRDVPSELQSAMIGRYLAAFPTLDHEAFAASYAVMGAQRNAKIVGIFTRLCHRDGKPHYLRHIPRVWRLLEQDLQHPALTPIRDWIDRRIPAERRLVPAQGTAS